MFKCGTGTEALAVVRNQALDLAILDVMLPDISGFTLCGEIRKEHHFPVLMLTAKAEDMDKITGLTIGADDYITKPFNPLELMARVKAPPSGSLRACGGRNTWTAIIRLWFISAACGKKWASPPAIPGSSRPSGASATKSTNFFQKNN